MVNFTIDIDTDEPSELLDSLDDLRVAIETAELRCREVQNYGCDVTLNVLDSEEGDTHCHVEVVGESDYVPLSEISDGDCDAEGNDEPTSSSELIAQCKDETGFDEDITGFKVPDRAHREYVRVTDESGGGGIAFDDGEMNALRESPWYIYSIDNGLLLQREDVE